MGDGSYYKGTLEFACNDDHDVRADVARLLEKFVGPVREKLTGKKTGHSYSVIASSRRFGEVLEHLECIARYENDSRAGAWHRNVSVPNCIWKSPKSVVREFLRGLFESDGFNDYKSSRVVLFSKYEQFLKDVQILLLGFGITSKRVNRPQKSGSGQIYEGHELQLRSHEADLFNSAIGFVSERKKGRHDPCRTKKRHGRNRIPMLMSDNVEMVVAAGHEPVFDITVEPEHVFSANGILVHNCDKEAFAFSGRQVFNNEILAQHESTIKDGRRVTLRMEGSNVRAFDWQGSGPFWELFEEPGNNIDYGIGADVMTGALADPLDDHSDPDESAAVVHNRRENSHAAVFHGRMDPDIFGQEVLKAALFYNKAYIGVEVNGPGLAAMTVLRDYPFMYQRSSQDDSVIQKPLKYYGWETTQSTRDPLIDDYIAAVRSDKTRSFTGRLIVRSSDLVEQESTFVILKGGQRRHRTGTHDDILFAAMIAQQVHLSCPMRHGKRPALLQSQIPRHVAIRMPYQYAGGIDHGWENEN
jgi:hypothetical protein